MFDPLKVVVISVGSIAFSKIFSTIDEFIFLDQFLGDLILVALHGRCDGMAQDIVSFARSAGCIIASHNPSIWNRCSCGIFDIIFTGERVRRAYAGIKDLVAQDLPGNCSLLLSGLLVLVVSQI